MSDELPRIIQGRCFVCNQFMTRGTSVKLHETFARSSCFPFTKCIGELMGDGFQIKITTKDRVCSRCCDLINQQDKLKKDLASVTKTLREYLCKRYGLSNEENAPILTQPNITANGVYIYKPAEIKNSPIEPVSILKSSTNKSNAAPDIDSNSPVSNQPNAPSTVKASPVDSKIPKKTMAIFQCINCFYMTTEKSELKSHMCSETKLSTPINSKIEKPIKININVPKRTKIFKKPEKEILVEKTNDVAEVFEHDCKICNFQCSSPAQLKRHMMEEHLKKLTCHFCDRIFKDNEEYSDHSKEHISNLTKIFQCEYCYESFTFITDLEKHKLSHQAVKCNTCHNDFSNTDEFSSHLKPSLKIVTNYCSLCKIAFISKEEFIDHATTIHSQEKINNANDIYLTYICSCCKKEVTDYKEFGKHRDDHLFMYVDIHALDTNMLEDEFALTKQLESAISVDEPARKEPGNHVTSVSEVIMQEETNIRPPSPLQVPSELETQTNPVSVKKIYECGICSVRMDSTEELQIHFKTHKFSQIACKECKMSIPSISSLKKHLLYHSKEGDTVVCQVCGEHVISRGGLRKHMIYKHKSIHDCQFCGEQFRYLKSRNTHERNHPEANSFPCKVCSKRFSRMSQVKNHMETYHRDFHCRTCGKEIKDPLKLLQHEKRHQKEHFPCETCTRIFKTHTGLRNHVAVHTGVYKYTCDVCERGFMNRKMFIEHTNNHLEKPKVLYRCDICGKDFFYQGSLWIHRKWHNNPFPYECGLCQKKFRHASVMQIHLRKHRGERPYKCPYCTLTFNNVGTFRRHLIIHTGLYKHTCEQCKKGFTTKNKLVLHRHKIHGDPLPKKKTLADYKVVVPIELCNIPTSSSTSTAAGKEITENRADLELQSSQEIHVVMHSEMDGISSILVTDPNGLIWEPQ